MVARRSTNSKLNTRAVRMVADLADFAVCSDGEIEKAILVGWRGLDPASTQEQLDSVGSLRWTLER